MRDVLLGLLEALHGVISKKRAAVDPAGNTKPVSRRV
jgi:hypothetical protein